MLQRRLHFPPFPPERPPKCHMTPKIGLSAQVNWAEAHVYGEEGKQDTFISSPTAKLFYFFTFFYFWPWFLALRCSKWFTKALLPIFHPTILLFNSPKHPNPPPMLAILSPYSHINTPWVQFLLQMKLKQTAITTCGLFSVVTARIPMCLTSKWSEISKAFQCTSRFFSASPVRREPDLPATLYIFDTCCTKSVTSDEPSLSLMLWWMKESMDEWPWCSWLCFALQILKPHRINGFPLTARQPTGIIMICAYVIAILRRS